MEIGDPVVPNEDNEEEDLNRCNPSFLPLPSIRLGKGVWLSRWTLNNEERKIVAETGDIYIRMDAVDGDELVMPHRLFVGKPNIQQLKAHFGEGNKSNLNKPEIPVDKQSDNTINDKDELRLLIQEEINKAFDSAFSAALDYPVNSSDAFSPEKRKEREQRKVIIREVGNAVKNALRDIKDEAQAKIIEKTDPARAEIIRRLKPTF